MFSRCKTKRDGLQTSCKVCCAKNWAAYCQREPEKRKLTRQRSQKKHYAKKQDQRRFKSYSMALGQYDEMRLAQGFACPLCLRHESQCLNGLLDVDHCHDTGKVRGLLCRTCNAVLGLANENPEVLRRMAAYLAEHKSDAAAG